MEGIKMIWTLSVSFDAKGISGMVEKMHIFENLTQYGVEETE